MPVLDLKMDLKSRKAEAKILAVGRGRKVNLGGVEMGKRKRRKGGKEGMRGDRTYDDILLEDKRNFDMWSLVLLRPYMYAAEHWIRRGKLYISDFYFCHAEEHG